MRELNILEMVRGMNGEPIEFRDGPNKPGEHKTFKELLLVYCNQYFNRDNPNKMVEAMTLGQKMLNHKEGVFKLEDSEYKILQEVIRIPMQQAMIYVPIKLFVDNAKKV